MIVAIPMATGTVEPSTQTDVPGATVAIKSADMRSDDIHQKERHLVETIRPSSHRSANPFLINQRSDSKQLCIASKSLQIGDFELLKTLGTGQAYLCCCAQAFMI